MPRPKGWTPYTLADGTVVPSVTQILSRFKDSGGLIHWAWSEGAAGRDYRDTRDKAADSGTLAHAMVEAFIRGEVWEDPAGVDPDVLRRATRAFANFREWATQTNLKPVDTEMRLVSETHRYGGTIDSMLVNDRLSLVAWKTGAGIYPEYLVQLAAYGLLYRENFPERERDGGYHLLRFAKESADFVHYHFAELEQAARAFLLMRELWDLDKALKARVR